MRSFLTYCGTNVGGMAKGRSAGHKGDVTALIGQSHLQINADGDRDEFTEEEVADRIKKSSGANYDLGSNDGGGNYTTQAPLYLLWLYSLWLNGVLTMALLLTIALLAMAVPPTRLRRARSARRRQTGTTS